ncbi:MAG: PKD domain-containing protein, partial [Flavobacteriales bacterium]|nr:PKD domain-containing protein [Flavobacteriales bacterium]
TPYSEYFALVEPNVTSSFGSGIFFVDTSGNSISNAPIGSLNAFAFNSGNVQQFLAANFVHNDFGIVHGVSDTILTFSGFSESGCSDNGFVPLIPNNKNAYDTTNIGLMQLAITINESTPSFVEDNFSPIENYKPIIVCDQNGPECSLTADFTFDGSCVADSISFTNTSVDPGGNNIIYAYWDFGDGNHSELMNPKHKYNAVGTYDVMLYVINDSCGPCIDTVTYSVEIDDGCCIDTCTTCLIPVEGETYTLTVDVKDIYFLPNNVQGDTDTAFVTVRFPQTDSIAGPFYSANYGIGYNTISGQFVYPVGLETNALELRFHFRSRGVRFGDARLVPLSGSPVYIYDHNIHRFIEE